ncbi:MAG: hypothetical protein JRI72_13890 [Deltaproteobacteria bacterium]|nr:hypothetical protein [Deltaproteobacteria bacterium]
MKIVMVGGGGACIVGANTLRVLGNPAQIDIYTRRDSTIYYPLMICFMRHLHGLRKRG